MQFVSQKLFKTMESPILLLIEDNPLLTGLYKAAFEKEGINVFIAHSGKDGIELAKEKKPKAILLDFLMSGMNGLEVLKILKADPATKDIAVIMLTVSAGPETKEQAKALGITDYLVKSDLKMDALVQKVMPYLKP